MPNINQIILAGHLGRDAETKFTPNGTAVMSYSLATSRRWKKGEEWQEETTWTQCVTWQPSDFLKAAMRKCAAVMVQGRLSSRSYEKDG